MGRKIVGIDLFAGAGGLSLGAELAGVDVKMAVELDRYAAQTYQMNHPNTMMMNKDIKEVREIPTFHNECILFGGPPCQGFSTSNQKTRNMKNPQNWLFQEFIRIAKDVEPDWIVLENVRGIIETEKGYFLLKIIDEISKLGYTCTPMLLCASDFGVPQSRSRFFLIGSGHGRKIKMLPHAFPKVTVKDALEDLPTLENGAKQDILEYKMEAKSEYAKMLRGDLKSCSGHLVTNNSSYVIERYKYIPQGGNWKNIPDEMMRNYSNRARCHTGIYRRLSEDEPAVTVGNYRKTMLVHPWEDRGLSVREAARLQSFPDSYVFSGSIGFRQQQVGNAVPPLLAKCVFQMIINTNEG